MFLPQFFAIERVKLNQSATSIEPFTDPKRCASPGERVEDAAARLGGQLYTPIH
jgi:hypothetical protein